VGLALELSDLSPLNAAAGPRLAPEAPLVDNSLIVIDDTDRPLLTRAIRVPDRVTAHLVGDDNPDPALADVLIEPGGHHCVQSRELAQAFKSGERLCYVRETVGDSGAAVATDALWVAGQTVISCDAIRLAACGMCRSQCTSHTRIYHRWGPRRYDPSPRASTLCRADLRPLSPRLRVLTDVLRLRKSHS
jgi:hypothetical protein